MKQLWIAILLFTTLTTFATPREIVLIRHADRSADKYISGQFLSAKGEVRAAKFAYYFVKKFGRPDALFAAKPSDKHNFKESPAYRAIQTLAPIAWLLEAHSKQNVWVNAPYMEHEYRSLAHDLQTQEKFNHALVLICWEHSQLNNFAHALGVTQTLPQYPEEVYDTVYDLKYDEEGKLISFALLKNQYPVHSNPTWKEMAQL